MTLGETKVQINSGIYLGEMPIWRLYNEKGSKGFLTVTYNSFETMDYNEFYSDRFANIFLTHDVGNLHVDEIVKPRFVLAFNYGWGMLKNREDYSGISFKTMEHGYTEAGLMINDIFVMNLGVIKISLGVGYYHRLGAYQLQKRKEENSVFKFVLKMHL